MLFRYPGLLYAAIVRSRLSRHVHAPSEAVAVIVICTVSQDQASVTRVDCGRACATR
jgi:hypothetical protein